MKTLKFDKKYYLPIFTEDKTQTIRKNNKGIKAGEIVTAVFNDCDETIKIQITDVIQTNIGYISDDVAKADGFETAEQLKRELLRIYGDDLDSIWIYKFTISAMRIRQMPYAVAYRSPDVFHHKLKESSIQKAKRDSCPCFDNSWRWIQNDRE